MLRVFEKKEVSRRFVIFFGDVIKKLLKPLEALLARSLDDAGIAFIIARASRLG